MRIHSLRVDEDTMGKGMISLVGNKKALFEDVYKEELFQKGIYIGKASKKGKRGIH